MADHRCPAPQCRERVPNARLACRKHWYALPVRIRNAVLDGWRNRDRDGREAHSAAVADAMEFWHGQVVAP